jgi:hypothetical protein
MGHFLTQRREGNKGEKNAKARRTNQSGRAAARPYKYKMMKFTS